VHVTERPASVDTRADSIYDRMGVRRVINACGATTAVGGTLMDPRVLAAMADASQAYVSLDELNARVGERIAEITGAEAGYVTCGSCAAMVIAAAACIAGSDPQRIRQLPDTAGMRDEIVIHRCHRIDYDQMYRVAGGRLIEYGVPFETAAEDLEETITERTAAVVYHDSPTAEPGALDFQTAVSVAHARGVPVIVDAASTLPPVDHLRRWIRWGADLVIYSGGKGIRGPQDSGLLAGRADLIAAARRNGNPHASVGRGMKVSKEAMTGLWVAIDLFLETDHEAEFATHRHQAHTLAKALSDRVDTRLEVNDNWEEWPAPIVRLFPVDGAWSPTAVHQALQDGSPSIHCVHERGGLMFSTHCLADEEISVIIERLSAELPCL
jgi:D-glucosaminate-6-phosphate ammonia-lyase